MVVTKVAQIIAPSLKSGKTASIMGTPKKATFPKAAQTHITLLATFENLFLKIKYIMVMIKSMRSKDIRKSD
jgi:hypothetical protein